MGFRLVPISMTLNDRNALLEFFRGSLCRSEWT